MATPRLSADALLAKMNASIEALDAALPRALVLPAHIAEGLCTGELCMVVTKEREPLHEQKLMLSDGTRTFGDIELGPPRPMYLPDFEKAADKHGISDELRKSLWGRARRFYKYEVLQAPDAAALEASTEEQAPNYPGVELDEPASLALAGSHGGQVCELLQKLERGGPCIARLCESFPRFARLSEDVAAELGSLHKALEATGEGLLRVAQTAALELQPATELVESPFRAAQDLHTSCVQICAPSGSRLESVLKAARVGLELLLELEPDFQEGARPEVRLRTSTPTPPSPPAQTLGLCPKCGRLHQGAAGTVWREQKCASCECMLVLAPASVHKGLVDGAVWPGLEAACAAGVDPAVQLQALDVLEAMGHAGAAEHRDTRRLLQMRLLEQGVAAPGLPPTAVCTVVKNASGATGIDDAIGLVQEQEQLTAAERAASAMGEDAPDAEALSKAWTLLEQAVEEPSRRFPAVFQLHARGGVVHGDLRIQLGEDGPQSAVGFTLALEGEKPRGDVLDKDALRALVRGMSIEGTDRMQALLEPGSVYAQLKPAHDTLWLRAFDVALPPGAIGASVDGWGHLLTVDEMAVTLGVRTKTSLELFVESWGRMAGRMVLTAVGLRDDGPPLLWRCSYKEDLLPQILQPKQRRWGGSLAKGQSYLPLNLMHVTPDELKFWREGELRDRRQVLDRLVRSKFFTRDTVKLVMGEIYKVVVKYYLYQPPLEIPDYLVGYTKAKLRKGLEEVHLDKCMHEGCFRTPDVEFAWRPEASSTQSARGWLCKQHWMEHLGAGAQPLAYHVLLEGQAGERYGEGDSDRADVLKVSAPTGVDVRAWASSHLEAYMEHAGVVEEQDGRAALVLRDEGDFYPETLHDVQLGNIVVRAGELRTGLGKGLVPPASASPEEKRAAQKERAAKFGVEALEGKGERLTYPAGYPTKLNDYGDPVNLMYPLVPDGRARNARARFKQFAKNYSKTASKRIVHERIVRRLLAIGAKPSYNPKDPLDKLLPEDLRSKMLTATRATKALDLIDAVTAGVSRLAVRMHTPDSEARAALRKDLTGDDGLRTVDLRQGAEERIVYGEVLIPNEEDAHGDWYDEDAVREAAHRFMEHSMRVGYMHQRTLPTNQARVLESFIAPVDMVLMGRTIKAGTWVMAGRIEDDGLWKAILAGEITGWSIEGTALIAETN